MHSCLSRIKDILQYCLATGLGFGHFVQLPKLHILVLTGKVSGELPCWTWNFLVLLSLTLYSDKKKAMTTKPTVTQPIRWINKAVVYRGLSGFWGCYIFRKGKMDKNP